VGGIILFNPKREANFLETFLSTLHHIQAVSNNVKYSTDYFEFSRSSDDDADIVVMLQHSAINKAEFQRLPI
jgi:hypothetical protein